jgi:Domain of unknown function (DUF1850)
VEAVRGARGLGALLLLAPALALLALGAGVWFPTARGHQAPPAALRVVDETSGETLAHLPLAPEPGRGRGSGRESEPAGGTPLQLRYRHSVYGQPAVEEFAVTPAGLRLVRLASPSIAVLEYYARPEPIRPAPEGYEIRVLSEPPVPRLGLLASETGQRTVLYGGQVLPLAALAGDGHRVSLAVSGAPAQVEGAQRPTWGGVDTGAPAR